MVQVQLRVGMGIEDQFKLDRYWYRYWYTVLVQVQVLKINSTCLGMESEHDNHAEDRRWSYKCCAAQVESLNTNQ